MSSDKSFFLASQIGIEPTAFRLGGEPSILLRYTNILLNFYRFDSIKYLFLFRLLFQKIGSFFLFRFKMPFTHFWNSLSIRLCQFYPFLGCYSASILHRVNTYPKLAILTCFRYYILPNLVFTRANPKVRRGLLYPFNYEACYDCFCCTNDLVSLYR